jgi:hypothetical protein
MDIYACSCADRLAAASGEWGNTLLLVLGHSSITAVVA